MLVGILAWDVTRPCAGPSTRRLLKSPYLHASPNCYHNFNSKILLTNSTTYIITIMKYHIFLILIIFFFLSNFMVSDISQKSNNNIQIFTINIKDKILKN